MEKEKQGEPRKKLNSPTAVKTYMEQAINALKARFEGRPVSRSHHEDIQHGLDAGWRAFARDSPGPWLLAEGCEVKGLLACVAKGILTYSWKTDFTDGQRHACKLRQGMSALGYRGARDLYAQTIPPNQGYLFAASERGLMEWRLCDIRWETKDPLFVDAMRRARAANALYGTKWAARSLAVPKQRLSTRLPKKCDESL